MSQSVSSIIAGGSRAAASRLSTCIVFGQLLLISGLLSFGSASSNLVALPALAGGGEGNGAGRHREELASGPELFICSVPYGLVHLQISVNIKMDRNVRYCFCLSFGGVIRIGQGRGA